MMDPKSFVELMKDHEAELNFKAELIEIYEGDLYSSVKNKILQDFTNRKTGEVSTAAYEVLSRLAPINILTRLIDKLSIIYQQVPVRSVQGGKNSDADLLDWYETEMQINEAMNQANEFFNLFKSCLVYPYVHQGVPKLRTIKNSEFVVISTDKINPMQPTELGIRWGKDSDDVKLYMQVDAFGVRIVDEKHNVRPEFLPHDNPEGINPFGVLPYVYLNRSKNQLLPKADRDIYFMTLLMPVMFSDLNFAVKYQSFATIYTVDVDTADIKLNPNSLLELKSDPDSEKTPQIGTIKPQVDIDQVTNLIKNQFALWLNTRGVRPGAVGQLTPDNFASGISKMIDEMDTFEDRIKQVSIFSRGETMLWDLIQNYLHPVWVQQGAIENRQLFTPGSSVETAFKEQVPNTTRGDTVADLKAEVSAGFLSRRRAIKKLNPQMSDDEIDELIAEIDGEKDVAIKRQQALIAPRANGNEAPENQNT